MSDMQIVEQMFQRVKARNNAQDARLDRLTKLTERAGVAFTVREYTLVNAPLAADGMTGFALGFISDGRKPAETAGNGTGVLAMYDPSTDQWLRTSDYTAVVS